MTKAEEKRARQAAVQADIAAADEWARTLPRCTYRCHDCGITSKSWAAAQRHADETKHARIEIVLPSL